MRSDEDARGGRPTVVLAANSAWNILNFRMNLVRMLAAEGLQPVALVPPGEGAAELREAGVIVETIPMSAEDTSPLSGLVLAARYATRLRRIRPIAFLGFTPKPNIFGSMAASAFGIPVVNNVTGLGTAFIHGGVLGSLVPRLYRLALRRSHKVFLHNDDDRRLFEERGLIRPEQAQVIPGSGVDLDRFRAGPLPGGSPNPTFLFIGRLLKEKGVEEFVEAARTVRQSTPKARFQLLGSTDESKRGISEAMMDQWSGEGIVEYLGSSADVRPHIAAADCVVLPSYREGMPRVLLEAAAMGRPLIGTDVPGCRQIVDDGATGFLCVARSAVSLAEAMSKIGALSPGERAEMGLRARAVVETRFSEKLVNAAYRDALAPILDRLRCGG